MTEHTKPTRTHTKRNRLLRLGYVALTDAAPLLIARELDYFGRHGLPVELRPEIGWATIRDKVAYRELDGAHALAGMLFATKLGIGCPAANVLTGLVLNMHGNAITLAKDLADAGDDVGATLRSAARQRGGEDRLTFGVVFPWSTHHLQLLQWLREMGLDPDRDVRVVAVPPPQMFRNLAAGTIDGFCAGEPWNSLAVAKGAGRIVTVSALIDPGHVEKVFMVHAAFATDCADEHERLIAALAEACAWCDEPANRPQLVSLLAATTGLNLPPEVLAPALIGPLRYGSGQQIAGEDFLVFHRNDANVPAPRRAERQLQAMARAGLVPAAVAHQLTIVDDLYRDDIYFHATGKSNNHATHTV
jgi:ABC-type nitrate/sulfonate/bicarbonate transport system substrate-binding protein